MVQWSQKLTYMQCKTKKKTVDEIKQCIMYVRLYTTIDKKLFSKIYPQLKFAEYKIINSLQQCNTNVC